MKRRKKLKILETLRLPIREVVAPKLIDCSTRSNRIFSVMRSCETVEQLDIALEWALKVYMWFDKSVIHELYKKQLKKIK